jgi:hypothetical protein
VIQTSTNVEGNAGDNQPAEAPQTHSYNNPSDVERDKKIFNVQRKASNIDTCSQDWKCVLILLLLVSLIY